MARLPTYDRAICMALICERMAEGNSLRSVCDSGRDVLPSWQTVLEWLRDDSKLAEQYAMACELRTDHMADEILEIADASENDTFTDENGNERTNQEVVARARLRVDTRKWLLSKMSPRKYGDRVTQEVTGANGGPVESTVSVTVRYVD